MMINLVSMLDFYIYQTRLSKVHSGYTFIVSMCVPWELNLRPSALLTQCANH